MTKLRGLSVKDKLYLITLEHVICVVGDHHSISEGKTVNLFFQLF